MPEDKKPVQGSEKKPAAKMVPESDLIAFKTGSLGREKKLREELVQSTGRVSQLESELKIVKANDEDEGEISAVKQYLLDKEKDIANQRAELDKDLASAKEREKEVAVQTLASKHQVEIDEIKDAEDPEKEALRIVNERLVKEKEDGTPESVFESGTPGSVKAQPKDMSDEDFDKFYASQVKEAAARK